MSEDYLSHPPIADKTEDYSKYPSLKPDITLPEVSIAALPGADSVEPPKRSSMLLLMILFFAALLGGVGVIFSFMVKPSEVAVITSVPSPTPLSSTTLATINLVTQYENPFDQTTQYTNPFSEEQNPFDNLQ